MKTKEEGFRELINDLYIGDYSIEITLDGSFKRIEIFNQKGEQLIDYDQKTRWTDISYDIIWLIFYKEYEMNYSDIKLFMKDMLLTHFKIKGTTPAEISWHGKRFVDTYKK